MKTLTRKQLESRKAKAVRFTRDVLGDVDRADEIDDESLQEYAERRHIQVVNPKGVRKMPVQTRRELVERIKELEEENESLQDRLEEIADLAGESEEEDDNQGEE
ncbi:MAG: hypothetical protein LAN62_08405 [Acidobacteriia bacterium]|nr:hypothetical protein [Terriglobia bacterium]